MEAAADRPAAGSRGRRSLLLLVPLIAPFPLVLARIFLGVDFYDESYYLALPYRIALGDRPFVDELSIHQFAALVTYPLVKLYVLVAGGTEGIVLASRLAYFGLLIATWLLSFRALSKRLEWHLAWAAALVSLCFIPFGLPNLSYNTIAQCLMTIAWMLLLSAPPSGPGRSRLVACGACLSVASFAYQSMAVPSFLTFLWILAWGDRRPGAMARRAGEFLLGAAPVVVLAAGVLAFVGLDQLRRVLEVSTLIPGKGGGWTKLEAMRAGFLGGLPHWRVLGPAALALLLAPRRLRLLVAPGLAALCAFAWLRVPPGFLTDHFLVSWVSLLAPFLLLLERDRSFRARAACIWALSVIAGALVAYTSANGAVNAALGAAPACIVARALAARRLAFVFAPARGLSRALVAAPILLVPALLLRVAWTWVYNDDQPAALTVTVPSGPFAGLRTSPAKALYLVEVQSALRRHEGSGYRRLLVYDGFTGGYLMSGLPPASSSTWLCTVGTWDCSPAMRVQYAADLMRREAPMLVLKMTEIMYRTHTVYRPRYPSSDPVEGVVKSRAVTPLEKGRSFELYGVLAPSPSR